MSESFENVMDYASAVMADCDIPLLDSLKIAHDHELEHIRKVEYHRGYEDGQRSMDAEHRAVAMRLRGLRFDGGSHENLNKIAYGIYPCATGWTVESCEGLRDKIIELLGGVHDGVSDNVSCCACGDDSDSRDGQSEAVDVDGAIPDGGSDVPAAGGVAGSSFTQVTYDELDIERRRAVRALRKIRSCKEDYFAPELFFDVLYDALGCHAETDADSGDQMCDRLIHLLGGDEPTVMDYIKRIVREHDIKFLDMEPSGAELSQASVDAMSRRAESDKSGENCKTDASDTGESSKCRENYKSGHIADELQAKLNEADAAIANYREREKSFAESERLRENLTHDVEMWRKRAEYMRALYDDVQAKLDVIWEAVDE